MKTYVTLTISNATYKKLQVLANRLKRPKLKVVDIALDQLFESNEDKAREFFKQWEDITKNIKLGKKVKSKELNIEEAYE